MPKIDPNVAARRGPFPGTMKAVLDTLLPKVDTEEILRGLLIALTEANQIVRKNKT